ncbi:unannotated protein [freshwater metagenome]|jgi:5,10-methylenetetrahydromethanopterin reductase|uniref:Unannotated protein n=1 Tax=freshwater metagenome TaxID=449393 RepID=A0A6J7SGL7_9ZZZZ
MRDSGQPMALSIALAPSDQTPDLIALAEELGIHRAWVYDSPAIFADIWMTLGLAAARTSRIGLGSLIIASLRHPMVTAAAVAQLESLAPGRVALAAGAGFSARFALGDPKPMKWADVEEYVVALRHLLRGEQATWQGRVLRMLHDEGYVAARPLEVPILVAGKGPKGMAVAAAAGDGICRDADSLDDETLTHPWVTLHGYALALRDGESLLDPRVFETMAWLPALYHHASYERDLPYEGLPNGVEWRRRLEAVPEHLRHLAVHDRHMQSLNALDEGLVTPEIVAEKIPHLAIVGTVDEVAQGLQHFADRGADEMMMYVPLAHAERTLRDLAEAAAGVTGPRALHRARR